jgi:hypothetical protein
MGPRSSAQLRTRRGRQRKAASLHSNCSSLDSFSPQPGDLPVVPICRSSATLRASPNHRHLPRVPPRFKRGVSRSSRTLGSGMRWTLSVCRRTHLGSGRRSRVVLTPRRWRQVARNDLRGDGDKKARSPGRARRKPLKPFVQGMPDCFWHACGDYARMLPSFRIRGCGCGQAPGIPCAL